MTTLNEFLTAFFPDESETINFRLFKAKAEDDKPENGKRKIAATVADVRANLDLQKDLKQLNKTRGVYFVVNAGGDSDKDITRYNAFFVENDNLTIAEQHANLDACSLQPSIRIETKKSVHAYFLIETDEQTKIDEPTFRDVQTRLINHFDGDKACVNPSRVMRVPYFNHVAFDREAGRYEYKKVLIHTFDTSRRFTLDQMKAAFPAQKVDSTTNGHQQNGHQQKRDFEFHDDRNAELVRRIVSMSKRNPRGVYEMKCPAHNGNGNTSLSLLGDAIKCAKGCDYFDILSAFGLPNERLPNRPKNAANNSKSFQSNAINGESENEIEINIPELSARTLYGLAGEIVRIIEPHTESDNAALLIQLLAGFGNLINKTAYFRAENDFHFTKINAVLVGASSKGRKGSSFGHIRNLLTRVDAGFADCIQDGLSSGEGLIYHVRDAISKQTAIKDKGKITGYQDEVFDEGAKEKRANKKPLETLKDDENDDQKTTRNCFHDAKTGCKTATRNNRRTTGKTANEPKSQRNAKRI